MHVYISVYIYVISTHNSSVVPPLSNHISIFHHTIFHFYPPKKGSLKIISVPRLAHLPFRQQFLGRSLRRALHLVALPCGAHSLRGHGAALAVEVVYIRSVSVCFFVTCILCIDYVCMYVCMYVCIVSIYVSIYVSMYLCIYVSMYLCIYVSMYVCICLYVYVCMYIYIYEKVEIQVCECLLDVMCFNFFNWFASFSSWKAYIYMYIHSYLYIYICISICIHIYLYI